MPESFPLAIKPGWSCWTGCVPHPSRFVPPSLASQDFWSRIDLPERIEGGQRLKDLRREIDRLPDLCGRWFILCLNRRTQAPRD